MTPLLTWWPAMLAGGLALLFGWLAGVMLMAVLGAGVTAVSDFYVAPHVQRGELVQPHPGILPTRGGHYLVCQRGDQRPKVTAFCDWLRRELRGHQAGLHRTARFLAGQHLGGDVGDVGAGVAVLGGR